MRVFIASCFILAAFSGWADIDIDQQDIGSERITQPAKRTPFSFDTHVDVIGSSKIKKGFYKDDEINYAEAEVEIGMVVYYCPTYTEGVRVALGYTPTYLKWHDNPWFDQDHFNIVPLSLAGFSKRIDRWFWRMQLTANFDAEKWSSPYTSYDFLLWGRYAYCENIGIHFGFWAETGLHLDRVYPVLGFDWQISRKWKLDLVFPVNMALLYAFSPNWKLGVAGRFFDSRFRVHNDQHSLKPLVRYTNVGAEFIIKYDDETTSANLHAGTTLGGTFRVANHSNHHAQDYHIDPSAYVGAEIDVKF
jgi:hypothetical protein